ncbi:MAG: hypothetical protein V3U75_04295 [Methylococcaceae bacterium]
MSEQEQSSEVKDQEAEKSAAEEALKATADPASELEPTVPLHKHTALRQRAQAAEVAQARAEGQLSAIKETAAAQAPAVKSPMQTEIDRQVAEGIDEADMTFSPRIFQAELDHREQVTSQTVATKAHNETVAKQRASSEAARLKHDDYSAVVEAGLAQMTKGQILDIEGEVANFGENIYAKSQAIIAANAKPDPETPAPKEEPSEPEAEEKVPTQDKILADLEVDPDTARAAQL